MARDEDIALRNESIFREANERIAGRRDELEAVAGLTPFLCECEDEACTAIMRISGADYAQVRRDPAYFVVVPGHPTRGEATDHRGAGWVCVRK
jgi:hypothetical protein